MINVRVLRKIMMCIIKYFLTVSFEKKYDVR